MIEFRKNVIDEETNEPNAVLFGLVLLSMTNFKLLKAHHLSSAIDDHTDYSIKILRENAGGIGGSGVLKPLIKPCVDKLIALIEESRKSQHALDMAEVRTQTSVDKFAPILTDVVQQIVESVVVSELEVSETESGGFIQPLLSVKISIICDGDEWTYLRRNLYDVESRVNGLKRSKYTNDAAMLHALFATVSYYLSNKEQIKHETEIAKKDDEVVSLARKVAASLGGDYTYYLPFCYEARLFCEGKHEDSYLGVAQIKAKAREFLSCSHSEAEIVADIFKPICVT